MSSVKNSGLWPAIVRIKYLKDVCPGMKLERFSFKKLKSWKDSLVWSLVLGFIFSVIGKLASQTNIGFGLDLLVLV